MSIDQTVLDQSSEPDLPGLVPLLWAKTAQNGYHPLLLHLLDVAAVAETLWARATPPIVRSSTAHDMGVSLNDAGRWVTFFAAVHDIGKVSGCFQRKDPNAVVRLAAAGLPVDAERHPVDAPHGTISTVALMTLLASEVGLSSTIARRVATVVGGHHGAFPRAGDIKQALRAKGGATWDAIRRNVVGQLAQSLGLNGIARPQVLPDGAAIWLAGFISVADWIGSNQDFFPPFAIDGRSPAVKPRTYLAEARSQARLALDQLSWQTPTPETGGMSFTALFPHVPAPNPMQQLAIDLGERLSGPCMVLIEAQTGSGKTEAAIWLADRWATREGRSGVYFALPTRATSDQMFGRVRHVLERRYPDATVNLLLLHGLASLSAEFGELRRLADRMQLLDPANLFAPTAIDGAAGDDGAPASVIAAEWFTHRKRGLLAPFGVGTIDQALLAVLQTRHYFVRLYGLAGKTVVFDEVHAYDTYMSTILEQTLRWLAALGTSVVLLSATLPADRRAALVAAYREGLNPSTPDGFKHPPSAPAPESAPPPYPRISWVTREGSSAEAILVPPNAVQERRVAVRWVDGVLPTSADGAFPLGERLREALVDGGCAAVICNTVARAQKVYQALRPSFPDVQAKFVDGPGDDVAELDLLHARFRFLDREAREHRSLARFGKPKGEVVVPDGPPQRVSRPHRAVLVATQVIEQSLDLDFDLLVTDLAPGDLVLQRIGRLHRHERHDRPAGLRSPEVWIVAPAIEDDAPIFDRGSGYVYEPHVLLRSWLVLRDQSEILVPRDVEPLIEFVYDDERACPAEEHAAVQARWAVTRQDLLAQRDRDRQTAQRFLVLPPGSGAEIFEDRNQQLAEDVPDIHPDLQALTRLAEPTVNVVCLTPEERASLLPRGTPTAAQAVELLRRAVSIGDRRVFKDLVARDQPSGWKRSALLRHHRLIELDEEDSCNVGKHRIVRNEETGIEIVPVAR